METRLPELLKWDLIDRFKPILSGPGRTHYIDQDGRIKTNQVVDWDVPWAYVHMDPSRFCRHWQMIFSYCGCIPTPCLTRCWKVVVRPRTLKELFQLLELQESMPADVYCKCGIEERNWIFGNYGGYFYTNSKEEGLERYREVRAAVNERLSPDVRVILKRCCTEMEIRHGPIPKYEQPAWVPAWEQMISEIFVVTKEVCAQPEFVRRSVLRRWIEFAYDRGDPTALEFNGGEHLYTQPQTYHMEA